MIDPGRNPAGQYPENHRAATGNLRWVHSFGVPINGSAAIGDGRVYVPLAKVGSPSVAAHDFTNGNLLWQTAIDTQKDSDTFSSPVPFNGKVYTDFDTAHLAGMAPVAERRDGKFIYKSDRGVGLRVGLGGPDLHFETLNGDIRILQRD